MQVALAHPHLNGIGFDLAPVEPIFEAYVQSHLLGQRVRFSGGDFLNDSLPSAEVMVLGRVLHNCDLDTKKELLAKASASLSRGGALIVYDRLIDDARRKNAPGLLSSLNMLVMTPGGFDYTDQDCIG